MLSTSKTCRIPSLQRALSILVAGCALAACASEPSSSPPRQYAPRHAPEQRVQRRSRVIVRELAPIAAAARTSTPLAMNAARAIEAQLSNALAACGGIVVVDPVDLESAPPEFRDRLLDYEVRGELIGDAKAINKVSLALVAVRGGTAIEHFEQPCALNATALALDDEAVRSLAREIDDSLARRPWSTSVLDKAERMLIIGGGRSTGLMLGERLMVRRHPDKMYEQGIDNWIEVSGQEVAQIVVENYVGDGRTERGAQCRLVGGTIGGFEIGELSVEELETEAR
jgi:hypothetical protein